MEGDRLVMELIGAAVLAGAYRSLMRKNGASGGLTKLADKHSRRAEALADLLCARRVMPG